MPKHVARSFLGVLHIQGAPKALEEVLVSSERLCLATLGVFA